MKRYISIAAACGVALFLYGCASGTTGINPNPEKSLQKTQGEFGRYAKEHSYPADATKAGKAPMRAEVEYGLDVINIVNLSDTDWNNVEVWVNGRYVCPIAVLPVKQQKGINFRFFFDKDGIVAPQKGNWINKLELFKDGSLYELAVHAAD